jgi:hypothetical protein
MASIATVTVGLDAQPLAPAPLAGNAPAVITVVNLDTANTVNLGSLASQLSFPLGPGASATLNAPVWAGAATVPLKVAVIPGGGSYSLGTPSMQSAEGSAAGSQDVKVYTFTQAGRIWGVTLSHVIATAGSYAGGPVITACQVFDTDGLILATCRNAIAGPSAASVSNQAFSFPGVPASAGAEVFLNTENTLPAGASQAADAVVYYSVP